MKRNVCVFITSAFVLIGCVMSFNGIKPLYPTVGITHSPTVIESLEPTFRWEPLPESGVTYDLIVFEAIVEGINWQDGRRAYGQEIYYREGLKEAEHRIEEPLRPDTEYIWSVRRGQSGQQHFSNWSTYEYRNYIVDRDGVPVPILILATMGGYTGPSKSPYRVPNKPFLFKTPKK